MKNITNIPSLQKCDICNLKGFFCYTPDGADYTTCPSCNNNDLISKDDSEKYDFLFDDFHEDDLRYVLKYCSKCKILFDVGCVHSLQGCTSNVYNAHFVKRWKNNVTNMVYDGMPQFEDTNDWFTNANNIEIIEMYCPHKNAKCFKSHYPNAHCCELRKKK
jgi:hypothetical protein